MSITIKLDRPAVRDLIDNDTEMKFELTNAVVSEVVRKVFEKDMGRLMKEAEPELFKRAVAALQENADLEERIKRALDQQMAVRPGYSTMPRMSPALQDMFNRGVLGAQAALEAKVGAVLSTYVTEQAAIRVEELLKERDIDERIAKRVDRMLNEEVEKKVLAHHDALLKKMKEALA